MIVQNVSHEGRDAQNQEKKHVRFVRGAVGGGDPYIYIASPPPQTPVFGVLAYPFLLFWQTDFGSSATLETPSVTFLQQW